MTAERNAAIVTDTSAPELPFLRTLVLARLAADHGATRNEAARDLAPLIQSRMPANEARPTIEREIAALVMAGLVRETKARFTPTEAGMPIAARFLHTAKLSSVSWHDIRDLHLAALALGLGDVTPTKLKPLAKPEVLRSLIVQKAFGLPLKPATSASRLRSQLAVLALERAFGNKIKSGLGAGGGLSAKAGRLLAGQLSVKPQDYGTDSRLIAALAAEHVGAKGTDADAVRHALVAKLIESRIERVATGAPAQLRPVVSREPANDAEPARPDLDGFARQVRTAAAGKAEGWPGNRKAFISLVWQVIRVSHPEWRLSEIEFKCMLAEAHRAGLVVLAGADLKDKRHIKELQESAIAYKNTVWHYVRVEE